MGFSPADCEALLSLAKGLSYQIGIKYGYWSTPPCFPSIFTNGNIFHGFLFMFMDN